MPSTIEKIIEHLHDTCVFDGPVDAETPLFSSGALDSIAMISLIAFVEQELDIEIRADEVTLENFDTAERISRFALERAA